MSATDFKVGKVVADWLVREIPGAVRKAVQDVGGLKWAGTYEPGKSYARGDMVRFSNSLWCALSNNASIPNQASADWDFML